ncbi:MULTISPECIES: hypothetical protein [unclassified Zymobacter]|uniref:hypothetical protein n=1 Tax=unclassified Zymobacter TaxID=3048685 RepID=UPI0039C3E21C
MMSKFLLFTLSLLVSVNLNAKEIMVDKYSVIINKANREIMQGGEHRENGLDLLDSITGVSVNARTTLAIDLMSHGGIRDAIAPKARLLLESAFREGDMDAGRFLLNFYVGEKVDTKVFPKNNEKAIYILKKVLFQHPSSSGVLESLLGELLLEQGQTEESIFWLEQSVDRGNVFATKTLVSSLSYGDKKDIIKAWFYSDIGGSSMASERYKLEQQMTPEQIEQAQQISWYWQDVHHIRLPGYREQGSPIIWQVE